jgi:hypothetical protein
MLLGELNTNFFGGRRWAAPFRSIDMITGETVPRYARVATGCGMFQRN